MGEDEKGVFDMQVSRNPADFIDSFSAKMLPSSP